MHMFPQGDQVNAPQHRRPSQVRRIVTFLLIVILMIAGVGVVSSFGARKAHADTTWTPVWSEDFNGGAGTGVDTSNWLYDTGTGWGTGEVETMSSSTANVQQDGNGHLNITALRDGNGNWTSGRLETQRTDFAAPAGGQLQVSASIQQPNVSGAAAAGYWPAFWMLGAQYRVDHNWPNDGEIDTMEDVNGLSSVFGTLHCGVDPGGPCNETTGIGSGQHACPGCQTGFHTYSVIVDRSVSPEQIRWYLDGNNYFTISANQVDATTWANAVDHGFFIILDLAMGGGFPNAFGGGPTSVTQSGASMIVDNVQVSTMSSSGGTGGYSYIKNRNSGKVLDDTGWSTANGTAIEQWDQGSGQANQEWSLVSTGDGYYYIQNRFSGKALDDTGWSTAAGTTIEQWDQGSGQANQEWSLVSTGDGYYYIQNRYSGKALDVTGWSTANGTTIEQWDRGNGQANQEWQLTAA